MKLKNYWKRFWTLDRHHAAGFTLVELIVVIAILAILAGVAIPVYSGYIKKANIAADEQLLAAVNTAFAAACLQNGESHTDLDETPTLTLAVGAKGGLKVSSVSIYDEAFQTYFAGNENSEFKVYTAFNYVNGAFVGSAEGNATVTIKFNGTDYTINQSSVDDFKAATVFSENVEELQDQVTSLSGAFTDLVTAEDVSKFGPDYAEFLATLPAGTSTGDAAVLYVASKAQGMTPQDIANKFLEYGADLNNNNNLLDAMAKSDDMLTDSAMMYGALIAYVNSDNYTGSDDYKNRVQNVNSAFGLLEVFQEASQDNSFLTYVGEATGPNNVDTSDQFDTDMNGFLGALDVINTVSGGIDTTGGETWTSDAVNDLLASLLGNN